MSYKDDIMDKEKKIKELEYENRLLKITFCKCSACKYADLYIPLYTYPFFDPKCKITGKNIKPDDNACEDFELIGRNGR